MANNIYNIEPLILNTKAFVENALCELVQKISMDYNLDANELKLRYHLEGEHNTDPITPIKNQSTQQVVPDAPNKKSRKKKIKDEYTEMTKYIYEGKSYLMDKQNNIYTFNVDAPTHIGQKLVNGAIKFFDNDYN